MISVLASAVHRAPAAAQDDATAFRQRFNGIDEVCTAGSFGNGKAHFFATVHSARRDVHRRGPTIDTADV